jgi:hypothetical protein
MKVPSDARFIRKERVSSILVGHGLDSRKILLHPLLNQDRISCRNTLTNGRWPGQPKLGQESTERGVPAEGAHQFERSARRFCSLSHVLGDCHFELIELFHKHEPPLLCLNC